MASEKAKRLNPLPETLREIFLKSGNCCAFPGCQQLMMNSDGVFIGQVCHIESAEEGGERFNENQTNEERRQFSNLMLMCYEHHTVTNDVTKYTVALLQKMKSDHESKFTDVAKAIGESTATGTARLEMIVRAFKEDASREKSNGMELLTLFKKFVAVDGDFMAGQEVIRSLMRLIERQERDDYCSAFYSMSGRSSPIASPMSALASAFAIVARTDTTLFIQVRCLLESWALKGGSSNFFDYSSGTPHKVMEAVCGSLAGVVIGNQVESHVAARDAALQLLVELFCKITIIYAMQGFELPDRIKRIYLSSGRAAPGPNFTIPDDERLRWPPGAWFSVMHMIAHFEQVWFSKAVAALKSKVANTPEFVSTIASTGKSLDDCKHRAECLITSFGGHSFNTGTCLDTAWTQALMEHINFQIARANAALPRLKQCLYDERELLWPK